MTHEEIDNYGKRLVAAQAIAESGDRNKELIEIRKEVGAAFCGRDVGSPSVRDAENIAAIHQALQTWSMIDACRTAAKNHEITLAAMKEAAKSQCISKYSMIAAWIAAIAAWAAVILPLVARLVWAGVH
ncbi:MAG: hypothetical protein JW955_20165 [Sedimentisphaerales bacterium]|nr:hypothetical protein [Sedimentisphaerales bacterium]